MEPVTALPIGEMSQHRSVGLMKTNKAEALTRPARMRESVSASRDIVGNNLQLDPLTDAEGSELQAAHSHKSYYTSKGVEGEHIEDKMR